MYFTGFFLDSTPESCAVLTEYAQANNKPIAFNLSAPFVMMFHYDGVCESIKKSDFVFGNEDECSFMAEKLGLEATDRLGAAKLMATMGQDESSSRVRHVIITQGAQPTIVVTASQGQVTSE